MQVQLSSGLCGKLGVKYLYKENVGWTEPIGTEIRLTVTDKNGKTYERKGKAYVHKEDKFSRHQGRKWALVSLFKKDEQEESFRLLSKDDKRELFQLVCPYFFQKPLVKKDFENDENNMEQENSGDYEENMEELQYDSVSMWPYTFALLIIIVTIIYWWK